MYTTKFSPQKTRTTLIERSRLLNQIVYKDELSTPLTLIVAPSGYGKSTLLAQSMNVLSEQGETVCWLTLDTDDNTEEVFITYLIESYQRSNVNSPLSKADLNNFQYPKTNHTVRLQQLLIDMESSKRTIRVVLDDCQYITSSRVLQHIEWLLKRAPNRVFFYLISKSEPPLPIINDFRMKNNLTEINANDLNFTLAETQRFFSNEQKTPLESKEIEALYKKTEGWVVAVQLASLAIKNKPSYTREKQSFIDDLSGSDKEIVNYLENSIFEFQDKEVQRFLLFTSILTRFNRELCIAIYGHDSAENILEYVSNQGLFIFELDRNRIWFRYHHLFREYLLEKLKKLGTVQYQDLARKAGQYFANNGFFEEAISYYLLGEDFEKASALLSEIVIDMVQYRGKHSAFLKLVKPLPFIWMLKKPNIIICYTWSLLFTLNFEKAQKCLQSLRQYTSHNQQDKNLVAYNSDMLHIIENLMSGDFNQSREGASLWLNRWEEAPRFEHAIVLGSLGAACLHTLEFPLARKSLIVAKNTFESLHCDYGVAWMEAIYALVHYRQGHFLESKRILKRALSISNKKMGEHSYTSSMINTNLSLIYYESHQHDLALTHLDYGFSTENKHGIIDIAQIGYLVKARLQEQSGQIQEASRTLMEAESYGRESCLLSFDVSIISERILLLLRSKQHLMADELFNERFSESLVCDSACRTPLEIIQIRSLQIRFHLIHKKADAALPLLSELIRLCKKKRYDQFSSHLLLLQASANYHLGKQKQAFRTLNQVIEQSINEEKISLFVEESYHLNPLLIDFLKQKNLDLKCQKTAKLSQFLKQLCDALNIPKTLLRTAETSVNTASKKLSSDELTQREQELLLLLKQGLSNKELGRCLYVSESTIKWHLSRIYTKLKAKNRVDAIKIYFK